MTSRRSGYDGRVPPEDESRPSRTLAGRLALGGLLALAATVPFTVLALLVTEEWSPLLRLDLSVANGLNGWSRSHAHVVDLLTVGAHVLDPWTFRVVLLAVVVLLWQRGARRLAVWAVATATLGGVLGVVLKVLVERTRPVFDVPVAHANGYSFPSGHALNSLLCTGIVLLVYLPVLKGGARVVAYVIATAVVLLTAFDRIALGVHYVSDVLAGWIIAIACLAGTAGAFEVWRREHGRTPSPPSEGVDPEAAPQIDPDSDAIDTDASSENSSTPAHPSPATSSSRGASR